MDHPRGGVTAETWRQHAVDDVHNVIMAGDKIQGVLMIRDARAIAGIERGRRHLSSGYDFELVAEPGRTDAGEEYEFQQRSTRATTSPRRPAALRATSTWIATSSPDCLEFVRNAKDAEASLSGSDLWLPVCYGALRFFTSRRLGGPS